MVKKKKSQFFLSSSRTGESVSNAKQTFFYFWPKNMKFLLIYCFNHLIKWLGKELTEFAFYFSMLQVSYSIQ